MEFTSQVLLFPPERLESYQSPTKTSISEEHSKSYAEKRFIELREHKLCRSVKKTLDSKPLQQPEVKGGSHGPVPGRVQVQVVPGVVLGPQPGPVRRVPHRRVKVDDGVEPPGLADPRVDPLPRGLPLGRPVRLPLARERRDRRPEHGHPAPVQPRDDLLVRADQPVRHALLGRGRRARRAHVVDALEHERPRGAAAPHDVPPDAAQRVGPQAVGQHAVAARRLVDHGDGGARAPQARLQRVGPPVVAVGRAAAPVGDAVAHGDQGRRGARQPRLDGGEQVPVVRAAGAGERREVRRVEAVARRHVAGRAAAGVARDGVGGLPAREVDRHRQVGLGLEREVERVRDGQGAVGDGERGGGAAGECDGAGRAGDDGAGARGGAVDRARARSRYGYRDGGDGQVGAAEGVADPEPYGLGSQADPHRLAERGVLKDDARLVLLENDVRFRLVCTTYI
ncbi:uncharacterized protein E0L32_011629 [Thyridium curvatum]|uniref:Uncharacterized protein n=1 Tax=Thyridium curvatum TaxID=1093900 RepID=A0A507BI61_9PEZI|nr:uncharacterized protein E0L32_011629 [Thyridium curvatum]TPX18444.1 hypothetical protein E0L32_011629 [Thyridium curvatum]